MNEKDKILEAAPPMKFTRPKLKKFKQAFCQAVVEKGVNGTFTFEGHEFLVRFAGYLIEHLENQFKTKK